MREEARLGYTNDSVPNREFADMLDKYTINYEREFHISHFSYDFKVGDDILVEINPFATHNTLWTPFNPNHGISEDYHLNKSLTAEKHNFHCIHIFDWDDQDEIVRKLISKEIGKFQRIVECDFSKSSRKELESFGFNLIKSEPPRCHWYNPKTKDHFIDNENNHLVRGYVPIYDCGIYTYEMKESQA